MAFRLRALVDDATFLFPVRTMDALKKALPAAPPAAIELSVRSYLSENPVLAEVTTSIFNGHLTDLTPHPAYDDLPDLVLLFENGMS